jgi:manganese-dependent inorganic pyrophosphatase
MTIKVFGHISPDTDTVCSAIAYAWFLQQKGRDAVAYRLGELNKETKYVLNKFNIETPDLLTKLDSGDEVIIVDTNNRDELLEGIENASILEIIDHHKLSGNLSTNSPVPIIIKPIASTATIIWKHIKHSEIAPSKEIAGILLAALLSDTLKLTSPTTTQKDKSAAGELSEIADIDMGTLADEMFEAKSDLTGMSIHDILTVDSKVFEMGTKKVRISVLETTKPDNALSMVDDLVNEIAKIKSEEKIDYMFFFVTDIVKSNTTVLKTSDDETQIVEKSFGKRFEGKTMILDEVVSRKKQIIPALQPVIEKED